MIDQNAFRSCLEYREILRILQKASNQTDNIVWQSLPVGKNIIKIHHLEIDFVSRGLEITYDANLYKVDPKFPLYVKLEYRSSIFKISDYQVGHHSISCQLPEEIKSLELRSVYRHRFKEKEERYVYLRPSLNVGPMEAGHELKVRVIDISSGGLGIIISEQNRSYMRNNRILWITKLQEVPLEHPVLAEVVYITNDDPAISRKKELKVGLKLSGIFPPENYEGFISGTIG